MLSHVRYERSFLIWLVKHLWLAEDGQLCPATRTLSIVKYKSPKLGTTNPDRKLFTLETESFTINELQLALVH